MDAHKVLARAFGVIEHEYTFKDTILYALGVGLGAKPLDPKHLRFLCEDGLLAMPASPCFGPRGGGRSSGNHRPD